MLLGAMGAARDVSQLLCLLLRLGQPLRHVLTLQYSFNKHPAEASWALGTWH